MMKTRNTLLQIASTISAALLLLFPFTFGAHFRGGSISWKSDGGLKVRFHYRLGYKYGKGPGCTKAKLNQLVTSKMPAHWRCMYGCPLRLYYLHVLDYICTGADPVEEWEQGQNDFVTTFPNEGPFTIGFASNSWIKLSNTKGGGDWNISTTVDLRKRSDTGSVNNSPQSTSKPIYYVPFNDNAVVIKVPVFDEDNDRVRCRWATGDECKTVCDALPAASLDEDKCVITINTSSKNSYVINGIYAAALTIEDFPRNSMTMGKSVKTPSDVISSIPVQFLVKTIKKVFTLCLSIPRFIQPTPAESEEIVVEEGETADLGIYADGGRNGSCSKVSKIFTSGPIGMAVSGIMKDLNDIDTFWVNVTWKTSHNDVGTHILCADVENDKGKSGTQRCFSIRVVENGCQPPPCLNNGRCMTNNGSYACHCRPGFKGVNCEVDIDECLINPCPPSQQCVDKINSRSCVETTTSSSTTTTTTNTTPITTTSTSPTATSTTATTPTSTMMFTTSTRKVIASPTTLKTSTTKSTKATNNFAFKLKSTSDSPISPTGLTNRKGTHSTTNRPISKPEFLTPSAKSKNNSNKSCTATYNKCRCLIKTFKMKNVMLLRKPVRVMVMGSVGFTFGLALSILSRYLCREIYSSRKNPNHGMPPQKPYASNHCRDMSELKNYGNSQRMRMTMQKPSYLKL